MKLVAFILSYNLPSLTDKIWSQLCNLHSWNENERLFVFDNGSDKDKISIHTTHRSETNRRSTGGWNECMRIAREMKAENVWLISNDIEFVTATDPVKSIYQKLTPKLGCIHPSLIEPVPGYAYPWMLRNPNKRGLYEVKMVDFIAPWLTKDALEKINWQFDPAFSLGWGIDWEATYLMRKAGFTIGVDFDSTIAHKTSAVYDGGLDSLFANRGQYYNAAHKQMSEVLTKKYGPD